MNITIKQDPSADWTSRNPVLEQFCLGYETDTGKAKMGDGVTAWSSLGYFAPDGGTADLAATVRATTLTGLSAGSNQAIADTDTILEAFENVQAQIDGVGGAVSPLTLTSNGVSEVPLTIELAASQAANAFEVRNSSDTLLAYMSSSGSLVSYFGLYINDTNSGLVHHPAAGIYHKYNSALNLCVSGSAAVQVSGGQYAWSNNASDPTETLDTGIARSAATIVKITNGSTGAGALHLQEMTAPSAPATNNVYLYAEDNGSGKTRLMALFPTGAAQQVAIEP